MSALDSLIEADDAAKTAASGETRGPVNTAKYNTAHAALIAKMRSIKAHYFLAPLMTDADYTALKLKKPDKIPTEVPAPTALLEGDAANPAPDQVLITFRKFANAEGEPLDAEWGKVVRWGYFAVGVIPAGPQELPEIRSTHHAKEFIQCPPGSTGKVIWISGRYENAKGQAAAWGPMFSTIVT
jgi:hypothetical protein